MAVTPEPDPRNCIPPNLRSSLRLLDIMPEAVFAVDHHGQIVFASAHAERMFGYRRPDLIGRPICALVPAAPLDGPTWWQTRQHPIDTALPGAIDTALPGAIDTALPGASDLTGIRRNGKTFPIQVSLFPLDDSGPAIVAAVIRDLSLQDRQARATTAARRLKQRFAANRQMVRRSFVDAGVPMLMVNARPGHEGEIMMVNPAFCDLVSRSEPELVGRHITDVVLTDQDAGRPGRLGTWLNPMNGDRVHDAEQRIRRAGGHVIWTSVSAALLRDDHGDPDYVFVHQVVDITERRRAERKTALRHERDRRIADVLQAGLVPATPNRVGPVQVATRYLPAGAGETVGGDWHDVFMLPDGRVAVTVGDVAGHGIESAVTMTRLRHAARALASAGAGPAAVIDELNRVMHADHVDAADLATVIHAQLDLSGATVTYSNAGHLPLIVLAPGDLSRQAVGPQACPLDLLGGQPIGVDPGLRYREHRADIDPRSTLIGFTDGLIERRHQDIDHAFEALVRTLGRLPPMVVADPEALAATLLTRAGSGHHRDDIAVVVISPLPRIDRAT